MGRLTLLLVAVLTPLATANAGELGDLHFDADVGYTCYAKNYRYHGLATGVGLAVDATEIFSLRGHYLLNRYSSKSSGFETHEFGVGVVGKLDIFEYVPWIEIGPTVRRSPEEAPPTPDGTSFAVGFGVDRMLTRSWSAGVSTYLHQMMGEDRVPAVMTLGLRVAYAWKLSDPF